MGKRAWGPYPLTEAAWLGGPETLRGLREQRYAGDAYLLGSAELRIEVGRLRFPISADVGLFAFGDAGRVYWSEEQSTRWHTAAGGGLWVALVNRANVVRLGLARSEHRTALEAGVGFAY